MCVKIVSANQHMAESHLRHQVLCHCGLQPSETVQPGKKGIAFPLCCPEDSHM